MINEQIYSYCKIMEYYVMNAVSNVRERPLLFSRWLLKFIRFGFVCVWQELTEERLVELQMLVQCAGQVRAEIQVLLRQLQDLQSSMCKASQRKEEVKLRATQTAA